MVFYGNVCMNNPKSLFDVREKLAQAQREAAKNPDHPINDGLKAHFEERKQKLAALKSK